MWSKYSNNILIICFFFQKKITFIGYFTYNCSKKHLLLTISSLLSCVACLKSSPIVSSSTLPSLKVRCAFVDCPSIVHRLSIGCPSKRWRINGELMVKI